MPALWIKPAPPPAPGADPALVSRLAALPVANLGDAMGSLGIMAPRIRHLGGPDRLCAPALTVEALPSDNLALHRALLRPEAEGAVLVVSAGEGSRCGLFGELMLEAAVQRGVAGLVLDAHVRDADVLRAGPIPIFAVGFHPQRATKGGEGRVGWPVACGGVSVATGDMVVGDADGVAVVPQAVLEAVVALAEAIATHEAQVRSAVAGGRTLADAIGLASPPQA